MIQTSKQKYRFGFAIATTLLICMSTCLRSSTSAQIKPVYDQGSLGLTQRLKRLNTTASVLMIGAHPDDEDTALLAYLARGESARTAYLSLTRGDGGQNLLGPELGEALGVIRTEELLQARKLDGAEQFFTRAYDYGFSKTLAEAKKKWDEKVILCDVVRVIRSYQPLVVIAQFTGTPVDGHGQHQYAGYISPIAVKAAGDSAQCKQDGTAWAVPRFYVRHRGPGNGDVTINTGTYDPLLGRSYFEIAMEARSQHRSQEQGVLELKGDQFSNLDLALRSANDAIPRSIFDGIDVSLKGLPDTFGVPAKFTREGFAELESLGARIVSEYKPERPAAILSLLIDLKKRILSKELSISCVDGRSTGSGLGDCETYSESERANIRGASGILGRKRSEIDKAIQLAAGVRVDAIADREVVVPGQEFPVVVRSFIPKGIDAQIESIVFDVKGGLSVRPIENAKPTASFFRAESADLTRTFLVTVQPSDAVYLYTQPYWLLSPRTDSFYTGRYVEFENRPFLSSILEARVIYSVSGQTHEARQPVEFRYADDIRGELRRDVNITPIVSVSMDQPVRVVARSRKSQNLDVTVSVESSSATPVTARVRLIIPNGWTARTENENVEISGKGRSGVSRFQVSIPADERSGDYPIRAIASVGQDHTKSMVTLSYPHIQTHRVYRDAESHVKLVDLATAPVKVGYVRGSGDRVQDAIREMGFNVEEITSATLASGDLSSFDTIVVGIRAYQARTDIVAHNDRLLTFVRNGGTLIVQYQLPDTYTKGDLKPFPAEMGPRVVDENAPVKILHPEDPILNFPNKITSADFEGWVQERNLYNFSTMDAKYVGLLESHDAGEPENKGGLVIADIGKGKYIYCSYSLFRQLPAGVPGAYRLLANMLSSGKTNSSRRGK